MDNGVAADTITSDSTLVMSMLFARIGSTTVLFHQCPCCVMQHSLFDSGTHAPLGGAGHSCHPHCLRYSDWFGAVNHLFSSSPFTAGSMQAHKSVILHILAQLKPGVDLTRVRQAPGAAIGLSSHWFRGEGYTVVVQIVLCLLWTLVGCTSIFTDFASSIYSREKVQP